jgi:arylamine N-acetyltransferase
MNQQIRNKVNLLKVEPRPSNDNILAQFLGGIGGVGQGIGNVIGQVGQGAGEAIGQAGTGIAGGIGQGVNLIGQGIGEMNKTPEGRLALRELVGAALRGVGQEDLGVGVQQFAQRVYTPEAQRALYETQQKAETEKAKRKAEADAEKDRLASIASLEKEERQSRRDFAKAGFIPKLTDDANLPPELLIEFTSPVSGDPIQLVKQTEATKRQVDVFQNGQKTKMYANSVEDAKKIKDINEASEKIDRLTTSLIQSRNKYTGGVLDPRLKAKMNQDITDLRLAYKKMAQLGVISESDVKNFIEKALPDPTRITLRKKIIASELTNFRQRALEDRDAAYEGRVYNYQRSIKPITDDEQKNVNDFKYDAQGNVIVPENLKGFSTPSTSELNTLNGYTLDGYTVRVKK